MKQRVMKKRIIKQRLYNLFFTFGLISALLMSGGLPVYGNAVQTLDDPNLVVSSQYKMPVFTAGEEARLSIPVRNEGAGDAMEIYSSIAVSTDIAEYPFEITTMIPRSRTSFISGGYSDNVVMYFNVSALAEDKVYPLKLQFDYKSVDGTKSFTKSETIYVKIDNPDQAPNIELHQSIINGDALHAGETGTFQLELFNAGESAAKEIEVQLSGFSPSVMYIEGSNKDKKTLAQLEKAHYNRDLSFDVMVNPDLDSGVYTLDVNITYKDQLDKSYSEQSKIYLPVESKDSETENAQLVLNNIQYPTGEVIAGENFEIAFDLQNVSESVAKNVQITVNGGNEILPKTMPVIAFAKLEPTEIKQLKFTMFATDDIKAKNYPIQIQIEYESEEVSKSATTTVKHTFSQYAGVFVKETEAESETMKPRVIINRHKINQDYVVAGEDFELTFSIQNTHDSDSVKNVIVGISSTNDIFSPIDASNTFYVREILAGESSQQSLTMRPAIDASFKTHNVTLDIQYEDDDGNVYTTKEIIGVPVMQSVKLVVGQIEVPTSANAGESIALSADFYNSGRAQIRNLTIRLEGDFETNDRSLYVGNVDAGQGTTYEASLIGRQAGELTGKMIFEFIDAIDQAHIVEREFAVTVQERGNTVTRGEGQFPENFNGANRPAADNPAAFPIVYGITGVLAVILAGFLVYNHRRKKKELEDVDVHA